MRRRRPRAWYVPAVVVVLGVGLLPQTGYTASLSGVPKTTVGRQNLVHPTYSITEAPTPAPPRGGTAGLQYTGMYVDVVPLTGSGATALEAGDIRISVTTSGTTTGSYTCTSTGTSRRWLCSYGTALGSAVARPTFASGVAVP